jgi:integrase
MGEIPIHLGMQPDVSSAIECYGLEASSLQPATVYNYQTIIRRFLDDAHLSIHDVNRLSVMLWLKQFDEIGTYNYYLSALKSFFAWLSESMDIPDPTAKIKTKKQTVIKQPRTLTEEEYNILCSYRSKARDIAVFLCNTGLRVSELCGIKPNHIDLNHKELTIIGKGRKQRTIPLNKTAIDILNKYNLSISKSHWTARNALIQLSSKLGIPHFTPHACRHFFATYVIGKGASIQDTSLILGHSSINTTYKYYYHPMNLKYVTELFSCQDKQCCEQHR